MRTTMVFGSSSFSLRSWRPAMAACASAGLSMLTNAARVLYDPFKTVKPVLDTYAQTVTLMGPAGAGQLTKAANQIAIAGLVQALSEALNFAMRAGLDGRQVVDVISRGAAGSSSSKAASSSDEKGACL